MNLVSKYTLKALFSPAITGKTEYSADEILLTIDMIPEERGLIPIEWIFDYIKDNNYPSKILKMVETWREENETETDRCE